MCAFVQIPADRGGVAVFWGAGREWQGGRGALGPPAVAGVWGAGREGVVGGDACVEGGKGGEC